MTYLEAITAGFVDEFEKMAKAKKKTKTAGERQEILKPFGSRNFILNPTDEDKKKDSKRRLVGAAGALLLGGAAMAHLKKTKIAGELQGATRSGRRPLKVETLLENEASSTDKPSEVFNPDVEKLAARAGKTLALLGTGAGVYHLGRRANEDRRLGRQIRLQQGY